MKRGQFYLIGAVIIILVVMGLITVVNRATVQPRAVGFFDLSKDYEAETSKVIDYGVYNRYSPPVNIAEKVQNITAIFAASELAKDPNIKLVFIYGNKTSWQNLTVSSGTYGGVSYSPNQENKFNFNLPKQETARSSGSGEYVKVNISGSIYNFNLTDTDNFYFVIQTKTPTGETNVAIRA